MTDPLTLLIITFAFVLAGFVKGVTGMGLPLVSLSVLTALIGLHPAMALMLVPTIATNIWQALVGGHAVSILKRLWPFLLTAAGTVWIGGIALRQFHVSSLTAILGVLLTTYAIISLSGWRFSTPPQYVRPLGAVLGVANGIITGMTGSNVIPGLIFMQSLGFNKDELVQALGILFVILTTALAISMHANSFLNIELGAISFAALIPASIGMFAGQKYRKTLSEERFKFVLFCALFVMGAVITLQALTQ